MVASRSAAKTHYDAFIHDGIDGIFFSASNAFLFGADLVISGFQFDPGIEGKYQKIKKIKTNVLVKVFGMTLINNLLISSYFLGGLALGVLTVNSHELSQ